MIIGASGAKPSRTADLERKLVHHCSPALAGLKPANMFVYREGIDADAFPGKSMEPDTRNSTKVAQELVICRKKLEPCGVRIEVLARRKTGLLLYVYRPTMLKRAYPRAARRLRLPARRGLRPVRSFRLHRQVAPPHPAAPTWRPRFPAAARSRTKSGSSWATPMTTWWNSSRTRARTACAAAVGKCTAAPAMRRPASAATRPAPQPTRTCSTRACPSTALPPSTRTSPPRRRSQQQGAPVFAGANAASTHTPQASSTGGETHPCRIRAERPARSHEARLPFGTTPTLPLQVERICR